MRPVFPLALCCFVLSLLPCPALCAQSAASPAAPTAASSVAPAAVGSAAALLGDPTAYVKRQFGPSFTVDSKIPPLFADLDGDGNEDLVLVGTSSTPLAAGKEFHFRVEDPYDAYFGSGDVKITSQFTLHFDGSGRDLLIVLGWRLPPLAPDSKHYAKHFSKFVLINVPFETATVTPYRFKQKELHAIEAVDRTSLHAIIFWDGKGWHWDAQSMGSDESVHSGAAPY